LHLQVHQAKHVLLAKTFAQVVRNLYQGTALDSVVDLYLYDTFSPSLLNLEKTRNPLSQKVSAATGNCMYIFK